MRAPALLVTGGYLGTLSHTLTAAAALTARGCSTLATIVTESANQPVAAEETASVLRRFLGDVPVHVLPRGRPDSLCELAGRLGRGAATRMAADGPP